MKNKIFPLIILLLWGCAYYNAFYNAKMYYNQGVEQKKKGNPAYKTSFRKSAEKCEKVIAWYPNSKWMDDAVYLLGVNLYEIDEYTKAEKKFKELLEYFPDSPFVPWAYLYLGKIYLKDGKVSDAMFYLSMAKKKGDDKVDEEVMKEELKAYLTLGEHSKVIQLGNEYMEKFPSRKTEIMKIIGDAYLSIEDTTRALEFYRKAVKNEKNDSLMIELGRIYLNRDLPDSTLKYTSGVKEPEGKILRARAFWKKGESDSAISVVEDIARVRRDRYSLEANLLLSEIYQTLGDSVKMMKTLEKAKGLFINDPLKEFAQRKYNYYHDLERSKEDTAFNDSIIAEDLFLYAEGLYLYVNEPERAIKTFQKLEKDFPNSYLREKSMLARAYLYINSLKDTASAIPILDSLSSSPDSSIYVKKAKEMLNEIQKGKEKRNNKEE